MIKIGIQFKIVLLVLGVVILSVSAISWIAFDYNQRIIEQRYRESLKAVAELKSRKIETFFQAFAVNIQFGTQLKAVREKIIQDSPLVKDAFIQQITTDPSGDSTYVPNNSLLLAADSLSLITNEQVAQIKEVVLNENEDLASLFGKLLTNYNLNNIYLTDAEGTLLFVEGKNRKEASIGQNFSTIDQDGNTIAVGRDSVYFSNVFFEGEKAYLFASAPVRDKANPEDVLGILIYDIDLRYIYEAALDTTGLGKTGELQLTKDFGNTGLRLNPARNEKWVDFTQKRTLKLGQRQGQHLMASAKGGEGEGMVQDLNGNQVLAIWQNVPVVNWGLSVQIQADELAKPMRELLFLLFFYGFIVVLVSLIFALLFSQLLTRPLLRLREFVNLLSRGTLPAKLSQAGRDEIGEMSRQLNDLVDNLRRTAHFANQIGQGNFEAEFQPASARDILGMSLLSMRDSIRQSAERDDERGWIVTGLAEIGDILPSITTIEELGDLVCEYVTNKIGAVQGAFYTVNDDDKNQVFLEMNASYAYHKKKYLQASFRFAEGLVGQAAAEQDTILRTEIPDHYMTISSGLLGDKKPKCLLITPLITNETVYGVLEFAGFQRFGSREVEFVKEISELIARTVFNIKVKENTERLLRESQKISRELQSSQEVLRQNAEVMVATQEQLQLTNQALQNQIKEVQKATDRTRLLLENASEVITIYEADATIRYISPSVEKILGYTQDEMIGFKDIAYVHPSGVDAYEQMFKDLIDRPDERVTVEFSYYTKSGERIWLEATGTNLLADPAIQGIVLNTRDITERRAAEREQRLRGQMQALSENSPDLITRISKEGTVFYINPTIEIYTGKNKDNYLQRHLKELELSNEVLDSWNDIIRDVMTKNQKISVDMDFPSIMGERIMQVNAIPEYNDQRSLESVLLVSHDITERKIIELEISQKNRKITESINYAKRIQDAILPDTGFIRQFLNQSFVLYKPRDVVSGDFPWFLQKEESLYIAAVDCTGHGVPGALMSLIGFFLLNNIVNVQRADSPGEILDLLDEAVTHTLRQDESDASAKDGMDIALCKINKKKMQVEYAGAHRPLYYMTEGELHEIKGNKFPIGGAQYKNRSHFTNTMINYREGDSIYLFSDGFPDQFGGTKNKKFSPRRIRDIIKDNKEQDLSQINRVLEEEFEKWRGNNKQTDDVLMIGIKL